MGNHARQHHRYSALLDKTLTSHIFIHFPTMSVLGLLSIWLLCDCCSFTTWPHSEKKAELTGHQMALKTYDVSVGPLKEIWNGQKLSVCSVWSVCFRSKVADIAPGAVSVKLLRQFTRSVKRYIRRARARAPIESDLRIDERRRSVVICAFCRHAFVSPREVSGGRCVQDDAMNVCCANARAGRWAQLDQSSHTLHTKIRIFI